ncbi:hypothetical protein J6590_072660 [Homalodisca vitripennis]|nr:hypothetical protein J6590_072660 [Homalodisca vitripennis]
MERACALGGGDTTRGGAAGLLLSQRLRAPTPTPTPVPILIHWTPTRRRLPRQVLGVLCLIPYSLIALFVVVLMLE